MSFTTHGHRTHSIVIHAREGIYSNVCILQINEAESIASGE